MQPWPFVHARPSRFQHVVMQDCLKTYEGCWTLEPMDGGTHVSYHQLLEPLIHLRLPGVYTCGSCLGLGCQQLPIALEVPANPFAWGLAEWTCS